MQEAMQLFQIIAPQGAAQGVQSQKIAVKLNVRGEAPAGDNAFDFNALLASMLSDAPMPLLPGQLEDTLNNLDWQLLDQSKLDQSTPVIDLTDPDVDNEAALQMLMAMAYNAVAPDMTANTENQTSLGPSGFLDLTQADPSLAISEQNASTASSRALLQAELNEASNPTPGEGVKGDLASQWQTLLADGDQAQTQGGKSKPASTVEQSADELTRELAESDVSAATGDPKHVKGRRAETTDMFTSRFKLSDTPPNKEATNGAGPSGASLSDSESAGKKTDHGPLDRTGINPDRLQAESFIKQESAAGDEKNQDTTGIRLAAQDASRSQTVANIKAGNETEQVPRDMETDVIRQIVSRMTLRGERGQSEMQIKLKPEFLGDLRLHVTTENQHVMVRITADSPAVKQMIEHNLPLLKSELQQHGLQIHKFDVFVGQENEAWNRRQQHSAFHDTKRGRPRYTGQGNANGLEEAETPQVSGLVHRPAQYGNKEVDFFA